MIAPPRLRRGDRIGVVAPSGPVERRHVLAGARALSREGFRVVLAKHLFDRRGHLAGTDAARLSDLNRMLRDPDIRCVLMARGGYGTMRIADAVDWAAMRRDPKIYAGFSDATFLRLGFARRSGVRTLHGPNLQGLKGAALARWIAWVTNPRPSEAVRTLRGRFRLGAGRGTARGIVLGGNLKLVDYAVGTDVLPKLRGAILFLEEVNEPPYKLDGMLRQLILAGSLRGLRGVALGDFLHCRPKPGRRELPARQVLEDHLGSLGIPCLGGFPAGHGRRNVPLPLGARATLDDRGGRLVFEQGLVS